MLNYCHIKTQDNLILYGTLHKSKTAKKPIVIIAHGYFSSNRIGPHRLYYQIGEELKDIGYNVIRFDLRGMGESDGDIREVKYEHHVKDLSDVINFARQRFNDAPIVLIAHCIGCNVSLPLIKRNQDIFKKVIFISPYFTSPSTINAFFDKEQQEELVKYGYTYRKGIYSDATFFSDLNIFSEFVKTINHIGGLIKTISAQKDQFICIDEIKKFYNETNQNEIIIQYADHNYLDVNARKELIEKIKKIIKEGD